jgi:DNA-binding SARP family transcriptional activator/tetratricopeptide (TPR) repeat protein
VGIPVENEVHEQKGWPGSGLGLELRLLGELQVVVEGREIALPASKKTRALLAYLVATGTPHRREWLCDLLWEGPDDPRGELRWSLAKVRPLLDLGGTVRLKTDRSRVAFEPQGAVVDLTTVRDLLGDVSTAPTEALQNAVAVFRGEFLDGLDLPLCYRFQQWCLAERAAASTLRLSALRGLLDRLGDRPEEALVHARSLVVADPLSEDGHAGVVRLLARLSRRREALAQYEDARRLLEREVGSPLSGALERARREIGPRSLESRPRLDLAPLDQEATAAASTGSVIPFVGRFAERARIDELVSTAANAQTTPIVLVGGEPGIGKSRLLEHLADCMVAAGGLCLKGRAFEAEAGHPYGAWIEALSAVAGDSVPEDTGQSVALLRPAFGPPPSAPADRGRLFEAVLSLLRHLARRTPLAIVLDDLQWLDEASSALLHYVARVQNAPARVLFACGVRPGELADNPPVSRVLTALEREGRVLELALLGLSEAETAELVKSVNPAVDTASVFRECDGNPLFALELSRAHGEISRWPRRPLQTVIAGQLATLDEPCRNLVAWASAIGRTFRPAMLATLAGFETPAMLRALERLERRGIIRAAAADAYDFVHDVIRRAAYQEISQPRRTLMHQQIARILESVVASDDTAAGDLVRHAEHAGDPALAARASVLAGERSLRLFANAEAVALARRGRSHLDRLPDNRLRRELMIGLLKIEVLSAAGPGMRPLPQVAETLAEAIAKAEEAELHAAAATGYYLSSVLHQQTGDLGRAQECTVRAAEAGRGAGRQAYARQLANTARCLIELETDIPRARALLDEAETLLGPLGQRDCELQWGRGLIERWAGDGDHARDLVKGALNLARETEDRWREFRCLTWLAVIDFECGRHAEAEERCRELRLVAARMGDGEAPVADVIEALTRVAETSPQELDGLDAALSRVRAVDDKSYLAYALNAAALLCFRQGQPREATAYADEALELAIAMERQNEVSIAEAMLARMQPGLSPDTSHERIRGLRAQVADSDRFSARTRAFLDEVISLGRAAAGDASEHSGRDRKRRSRR